VGETDALSKAAPAAPYLVLDPVGQRQGRKVLGRRAVGHGGVSLPAAGLASQPIAVDVEARTAESGGLRPEGADTVTVRST